MVTNYTFFLKIGFHELFKLFTSNSDKGLNSSYAECNTVWESSGLSK